MCDASLRRDEIDPDEVVAGEALGPREETGPAPQGQSGDAGGGDDPARCRQPGALRRLIEFAPCDPSADDRGSSLLVDPDVFHPRQVDHEAFIAHRVPRHVVSTASDCQYESMVPCEGDRLDHIVRVLATHYHRGSAVDHRVPDSPCLVVVRVFRSDEFPMQPACELRKLLVQCRQRSPSAVLMGMLGTV